jgi:hypothetical protein
LPSSIGVGGVEHGAECDAWVLAGWAAYFLVLSGGAHGISRFRHPIVPVLCVLAGAAAARRSAPREVRSGSAAVAPDPPSA